MKGRLHVPSILVLLTVLASTTHAPAQADLPAKAIAAMRRAATYYHDHAASHGGYVYYYSLDLSQRWGEGKADADTIFVQPPGTPTVGDALLSAYQATGDRSYLDAARDAAEALVFGQLQSGGWTQTIHFGPAKRAGKYRNGKGGSWNASSLDDDQTQSALRFLFRVDEALGFKHPAIHDAAEYGRRALMRAQFPNGAFPQVWTGPVESKPIVKASYPDYDWKTEGRFKNYWDYYTLNDNLAGTVAETLFVAYEIYKDDASKAALVKLGDFLLLAQMPDPQPGWCQQYSYEMKPIWARKFEPPAITGHESQDVMRTLIRIARLTKDKKYLSPIPKALAYYKTCILADGQVARYYELKTNKPLYMDASYKLTYDADGAPAHYGWKQLAKFDEIAQFHDEANRELTTGVKVPTPTARVDEAAIRKIVSDLDDQGRWISIYASERLVGQPKFADGYRYLSSAVFAQNMRMLSEYLLTTNRKP